MTAVALPAMPAPGPNDPQIMLECGAADELVPGAAAHEVRHKVRRCGFSITIAAPRGVDESWLKMWGAVTVGSMWNPPRPMFLCACGELLTYRLVNVVDGEVEIDEDEPDVEIEGLQRQVAQLDTRNKELEARGRDEIRQLAAAYLATRAHEAPEERAAVLEVMQAGEARERDVADTIRGAVGRLESITRTATGETPHPHTELLQGTLRSLRELLR